MGALKMYFFILIKGKVTNFNEENLRDLGKGVISTIYKIYVESYKEQKILKESTYLKTLRKEISNLESKIYEFKN